jgi:hypothetical protein
MGALSRVALCQHLSEFRVCLLCRCICHSRKSFFFEKVSFLGDLKPFLLSHPETLKITIANMSVMCATKRIVALVAAFEPLYEPIITADNRMDLTYAAFAHVNASCQLAFEFAYEVDRLATIVARGTPTLISLGWGFNDIPTIETCVDVFALSVASFVANNGLVGFDIDYETPLFSSPEAFTSVSTALRDALPRPLLLTITLSTMFNLNVTVLNTLYDMVNVQSYWDDVGEVLQSGVVSEKVCAGVDVESGEDFDSAVFQVRAWGLCGLYFWKVDEKYMHNMNRVRILLQE